MTTDTTHRNPEIVLCNGKPAKVILDIEHYREILERLEDLEDLEELRLLREGALSFRSLDRFLEEYHPGV